jgi:ribonucleoside-diphosphate reductase alpha chain
MQHATVNSVERRRFARFDFRRGNHAISVLPVEPAMPPHVLTMASATETAYAGQIIRRNGGRCVRTEQDAVALMKARRGKRTQGAASASARNRRRLTETVVRALPRSRPGGGTFYIEDIQTSRTG